MKLRRLMFTLPMLLGWASAAGGSDPGPGFSPRPAATVVAQVVAFETPIVYNRFGSMNPYGMVYALESDVEPAPGHVYTHEGLRCPADYRYKAGIRPRPLVLRGNVGDVLEVHFKNLLMADQPDLSRCRLVSKASPYSNVLKHAAQPTVPEEPRTDEGVTAARDRQGNDWPLTRNANLVIPGLKLLPHQDDACRGLRSVPRGGLNDRTNTVTCRYQLTTAGTHLFSSFGAPSGGEGDGGSLTHGLFGALHVEQQGSRWLRSQITAQELNTAWPRRPDGTRGALNYFATGADGQPVLDLLRPAGAGRFQLVRSELYAVIWEAPPTLADTRLHYGSEAQAQQAYDENMVRYMQAPSFREFTAIFHDELKTVYANAFAALGENPQLGGVKDGFGLNYGASGMGSILLANRLGIGPSQGCVECLYEEFFLQSWANGDPALLEQYVRDPANIFHSYLNDRVIFRNLHAGPKETHVFHLHAHQWLSASDEDRGNYLDSQTIGPMQGFQYQIYGGGLRNYGQEEPHAQTAGSGNRNRTIGDSIFHCHLYPHFAQGMWALWRTHDVLEDGTRTLPDGQPHRGLSLVKQSGAARPGTDPQSGSWRPGSPVPAVLPLPTQAMPPLPSYGERGLPGYPFFMPGVPGHRTPQPPLDLEADAGLPRHVITAGVRELGAHQVGGTHAAMQAMPMNHAGMDMPAQPSPSAPGSLGDVLQRSLALADFSAELRSVTLRELPAAGTAMERRAMQFHSGLFGRLPAPGSSGSPGVLRLANGAGSSVTPQPGLSADVGLPSYPSVTPAGEAAPFEVNGTPPQPGAPFADPCGSPKLPGQVNLHTVDGKPYLADPALTGFRRYDVSAIQLDLVVNKDGWHDPQGRINVLSGTPNTRPGDPSYFQNALAKEGRGSASEDPFFFRAQSGECVTFHHSNRIPKDLERDDFQVRTPTDIIGQHIHLVKFDVTSSDGSGNGFNYEDGTLAPDAVLERKCAANAGLVAAGQPERYTDASTTYCSAGFPRFGTPEFAALPVQTSVQRWFADPILTLNRTPGQQASMPGMPGMTMTPPKGSLDRTLRTVFTHDHFAPSSIQQHGFYSALLIEPALEKGTETTAWTTASGQPLADAQGQAVGPRAIIKQALDNVTHPDHREFALAVADFAVLYEPQRFTPKALSGPLEASLSARHGLDRLGAEASAGRSADFRALVNAGKLPDNASALTDADAAKLRASAQAWWLQMGRPVDPPLKPEAISAQHHNPFLVNYRQEPMPLRLGIHTAEPEATRCGQTFIRPRTAAPYFSVSRVRVGPERSVNAQRPGAAGDTAQVFQSLTHGDPCTPVLEGYEGERAQIRLIQGAQEVQHVFTVEGQHWARIPDYTVSSAPTGRELATGTGTWPYGVQWTRDNPLGLVAAQEVGISEHFEIVLSAFSNVTRGARGQDYLYHFGTQDALWNGAWGLMRVYDGPGSVDAKSCPTTELKRFPYGEKALDAGCLIVGSRLVAVDSLRKVQPGQKVDPAEPLKSGLTQIVNKPQVFPQVASRYLDAAGRPFERLGQDVLDACPVSGPGARTRLLRFAAVATRAEFLRTAGLVYDEQAGLADQDGLIILPLPARFLGGATYQGVLSQLKASYGRGRPLEPFVLRATAGDCVQLSVYNMLLRPGEAALPDRAGDAFMPDIVPLNVDAGPHRADGTPCQQDCTRDLKPSAMLSLTVPLLARTPNAGQRIGPGTRDGNSLSVGLNAESSDTQYLAPPPGAGGQLTAHRQLFYAGLVTTVPLGGGQARLDVQPYDFGPVAIRSYSDVIGQASHGLFGVVVVEPQGATVMKADPTRPGTLIPVLPGNWHTLGLSAFVCLKTQAACMADPRPANGFQEFVSVFQDGLNLWWKNRPVGDCTICDDSYDLGDRGVSYRSAPFWARLNLGTAATNFQPGSNLNQAKFPPNFFSPGNRAVPTPTYSAVQGQDVRFRVLDPGGRARQRAFLLTGYGYDDLMPRFGTPNSSLLAPGKTFTAQLRTGTEGVQTGCYLYRDGPNMFWAAGAWGLLDVRSAVGAATECR